MSELITRAASSSNELDGAAPKANAGIQPHGILGPETAALGCHYKSYTGE